MTDIPIEFWMGLLSLAWWALLLRATCWILSGLAAVLRALAQF